MSACTIPGRLTERVALRTARFKRVSRVWLCPHCGWWHVELRA